MEIMAIFFGCYWRVANAVTVHGAGISRVSDHKRLYRLLYSRLGFDGNTVDMNVDEGTAGDAYFRFKRWN